MNEGMKRLYQIFSTLESSKFSSNETSMSRHLTYCSLQKVYLVSITVYQEHTAHKGALLSGQTPCLPYTCFGRMPLFKVLFERTASLSNRYDTYFAYVSMLSMLTEELSGINFYAGYIFCPSRSFN